MATDFIVSFDFCSFVLSEIPNFLSVEECDLVIEFAKKNGLRPSLTPGLAMLDAQEEDGTVDVEMAKKLEQHRTLFLDFDEDKNGILSVSEVEKEFGTSGEKETLPARNKEVEIMDNELRFLSGSPQV